GRRRDPGRGHAVGGRPRPSLGHLELRGRDGDRAARATPVPARRPARRDEDPGRRLRPVLRGPALAVVALVVAAACVATPPPAPSASPAAQDMTDALARNPLPPADLFDLTRRLRGRDGSPPAAFTGARQSPPDETVGSQSQFWTYDFDAKKNVRVSATLRILTDHSKWWIENGVTVDLAAVQTTATTFETKIYPAD